MENINAKTNHLVAKLDFVVPSDSSTFFEYDISRVEIKSVTWNI